MEKQTKKAFDLAQNEIEEKQISVLKNIIKSLLQKKQDKEKEKDELEEEIKLIKQEIDDFKAGRLDKIKERHDINPKADKIEPIKIVIVNDNRRTIYPTQPWRWNYDVIWRSYPSYTNVYTGDTGGNFLTSCGGGNITLSSTCAVADGANTIASISPSVTMCGTSAQAFSGGTYTIGSKIINL